MIPGLLTLQSKSQVHLFVVFFLSLFSKRIVHCLVPKLVVFPLKWYYIADFVNSVSKWINLTKFIGFWCSLSIYSTLIGNGMKHTIQFKPCVNVNIWRTTCIHSWRKCVTSEVFCQCSMVIHSTLSTRT